MTTLQEFRCEICGRITNNPNHWFVIQCGDAELTVLKRLCRGMRPKEVAREQDVAISTVRSHICSIRTKTQTASIPELIDRVAVLPPITPAMKLAPSFAPMPAQSAH